MKILCKAALLFSTLLLTLSLAACSGDNDTEKESSIDKFTKETAHQAVDHINAPIDKAKAVQELVNQQQKDADQAIEELK